MTAYGFAEKYLLNPRLNAETYPYLPPKDGPSFWLWSAAANRHGRSFEEPDRFDVHRDAIPHLGFGIGIHFCIGAPLARMVARSAIGALVQEYPDLKLEDVPHTWQVSLLNRGLKALKVGY